MQRRPSGSSEDQDASTPESLSAPTPPTHGDTRTEKRRGVEKDIHDANHKKERRKLYAHELRATGTTQFYTNTSASAASSPQSEKEDFIMHPPARDITPDSMVECNSRRRSRLRNPWACSLYTWVLTLVGFGVLALMAQSFLTKQLDTKGCEMCYMRPGFFHFDDFDTEHTRFASKYSLYLYREGGIDEDIRVGL